MHQVKSNNRKYIIIGLIAFVFVMALLYYALFRLYNYQSKNSIDSNNSSNITSTSTSKDSNSIKDTLDKNNQELIELTEVSQKVVTVAIFGTDERSTETSRSDIIMVLKYYPVTNQLTLVSVPRDSRVYIEGYDVNKINSAYAYGGPELAQLMLETLFDTQIDYYFKFGFNDFKNIIDAIGGVKVNAAKDFESNGDVIVAQGEQTLNGKDALFYVRFRADSDGDFGRIKRQQEVIESLAHTLKEMDSEQVVDLIVEMFNNELVTDMTLTKIIDYLQLHDQEVPSFETYTLKTTSLIIDDIWFEIIDDENLNVLKKILSE